MVQWAVLSLCMAMLWVGTYAPVPLCPVLPSLCLSLSLFCSLFSILSPMGLSLWGGLYGYGDPIWGGIWGMTLLA